MVFYWDFPVRNPIMVILQIMFVKIFLVTGLVWQCLFFSKITMRASIVASSSTKVCHGIAIVLLFAKPEFYQIYSYFRITIKAFLYLINFFWMFFFLKVIVFFMLLHSWQGGLFQPHGSHLSTSLIFGRAALTKCDFKFVLQEILFYELHHMPGLHVILSTDFSDV